MVLRRSLVPLRWANVWRAYRAWDSILGHSDVRTTPQVYTHVISESVLRVDERLAKAVLDPIGPKSRKPGNSRTEEGVWTQ